MVRFSGFARETNHIALFCERSERVFEREKSSIFLFQKHARPDRFLSARFSSEARKSAFKTAFIYTQLLNFFISQVLCSKDWELPIKA
ncbi:MAG: hypothetical protein U5L45_15545 [Saprospiraceae bacterium]|nr:hypothetical protein [Saprospiraceae bacterium]